MKHQFLRAVSGLLCCALLVSCGAAAEKVSEETLQPAVQHTETAKMSLAYSKEQGFNPYLSASNLTLQCADLLFDRLVEIKDDFTIDYHAASQVISSGTAVEITVGNIRFADGSTGSAADVAASLEAARASGLYGGRFANVTAVTAEGNHVMVTLAAPDSMFVYLLDIPVLKATETASISPTASGRYSVGTDETGAVALVANASFADQTPFDTIALVDIAAYDAIMSSLGSGTISLYATEQDSELGGSNACNTVCYNLNNLIFLGVNATGGALANAGVRQAVSAGVSRRQIADKVYYSRAYVTTNLANSRYPMLDGVHTMNADADPDAAKTLLESAGYTRDEATGYYKDAAGVPLSLDLLCYSGNSFKRYAATLVQAALADCGIAVNVVEDSDFASYREKIVSGQFSLYIGEVKLYNNIDLTPFFSASGEAARGIVPSEELTAAYAAARADTAAWPAFETVFAAQLPFIPLVYKNGVVSAARELNGLSPTISDIFYHFEEVTSTKAD